MTSMNVVQISTPHPLLSIYVQNSSIPLILDVQFQTNLPPLHMINIWRSWKFSKGIFPVNNVWLGMMFGHGANPIFFNKKLKIGRPVGPITSHFFLIPHFPPPRQNGRHICIVICCIFYKVRILVSSKDMMKLLLQVVFLEY